MARKRMLLVMAVVILPLTPHRPAAGPADAAEPVWLPTGSMASYRLSHAETLLPDGTVLVTGGYGGDTSAERYDPVTGTWAAAGHMSTDRTRHTATLLRDGRVLVAGGFRRPRPGEQPVQGFLSSVDLYDPTAGTWRAAAPMPAPRDCHTATLLADGTVLVAGGNPPTYLAERYDPVTVSWMDAGRLAVRRCDHTATLLPDGRVLVAGGAFGDEAATAEIYDPATNTWVPTGRMSAGRRRHTATLLPNGTVLVAGGAHFVEITHHATTAEVHATAEVYDPMTGQWTPTGSMSTARHEHTATLLPDGGVLVTGGGEAYFGDEADALASAEVYDPATRQWTSVVSMTVGRRGHTATPLPDGTVLVAGGRFGPAGATAEVYHPARVSAATGPDSRATLTP